MKKRIISLLMVLSMVLSLCACGKSAKTDDGLTTVRFGTSPWATAMFFYLAAEKGIDEKNGIKIDISEFTSTTESMNAFVSGSVDFLVMDSPEVISPYSQYDNFKAVLLLDQSDGAEGLVTSPDIKTPADLKGKTIATQLYSVDHMLLLTLLTDNGMTADDVNIVDMTIEESGNAFIAGQCDAACIWDPYYSEAIASGGNVLFSSSDNPDLITDVLLASDEMCEKNGDAVLGIMRSYYEAVDYWKENPEEANAFMGEKLGVTGDEFSELMLGLHVPTKEENLEAFTESDDYTYWGYTQNVIRDFMYELGIIESNGFDCGGALDKSFIEKIVSED